MITKVKILFLIIAPLAFFGCKKANDLDEPGSIITATVNGQPYSSTNVFVTKDTITNELLNFSSLTADNVSIGIQLPPANPAYQTGTYPFRPSGVAGVRLVSFNIETINFTPKLTWVTDQESSVSNFIIERSPDGITFSQVGSVNAVGNTTTATTYSFTDNSFLNFQNYYYRLKIVNLDGSFVFSSIRTYSGLGKYYAYYGEGSLKYKGMNGAVVVTQHDRAAHIVYGTFYFDYINNGGETKQVRNGNFKIVY